MLFIIYLFIAVTFLYFFATVNLVLYYFFKFNVSVKYCYVLFIHGFYVTLFLILIVTKAPDRPKALGNSM